MEELRLDEDFMQNVFNTSLLDDYLTKIKSKALDKRVRTLLKVYEL